MADVTRTIEIETQVTGADQAQSELEGVAKAAEQAEGGSEDLSIAQAALGDVLKQNTAGARLFGLSLSGLSTQFKALRTSVVAGVRSLGAFRVALIATGIGAILVLLGSFIAFIQRSQVAVDAINRVLNILKFTLDAVFDSLKNIGLGLFQIFSGDIQAGLQTLSNTFSEIGDNIQRNIDLAEEYTQLQRQLAVANNNLIVQESAFTAEIDKRRELLNDEQASNEDRIRAGEEALELENLLAQARENNTRDRLRLLEIEAATAETLREAEINTEIARLTAQLNQIESQRARSATRTNRQLQTLRRQDQAERDKEAEEARAAEQAILDEEEQEFLDRLDRELEAETEFRDNIKALDEQLTEDLEEQVEKRLQTDKDFQDESIKNAEFAEQAKRTAAEQTAQAEQALLLGTASLIGETTAAGKAISIAQATIATWRAANEVLATPFLTPAQRFIQVAAAIAAGLANVKRIVGTPIPEVRVREEFAQGGIVEGRSHRDGGERFAVGSRVVELEGGEAVINRRATQRYRPLLSAINESTGGKRFQFGGVIPSPVAAPIPTTQLAQQQEFFEQALLSTPPVLVVEDVTSTQNQITVREDRANLG